MPFFSRKRCKSRHFPPTLQTFRVFFREKTCFSCFLTQSLAFTPLFEQPKRDGSRTPCLTFSSLLRAHLVTPTCASRHSCVPICYLPPCRGKWQVGARFYLGAHLSEIRRRPLQKSNNFDPFFSDSTLTFLTSRNTFRLPILPTRRIILLCLPLIKIRRRQILTGCAPNFSWERSKIAVFKGKVTKKGGSRGSSHISIQI